MKHTDFVLSLHGGVIDPSLTESMAHVSTKPSKEVLPQTAASDVIPSPNSAGTTSFNEISDSTCSNTVTSSDSSFDYNDDNTSTETIMDDVSILSFGNLSLQSQQEEHLTTPTHQPSPSKLVANAEEEEKNHDSTAKTTASNSNDQQQHSPSNRSWTNKKGDTTRLFFTRRRRATIFPGSRRKSLATRHIGEGDANSSCTLGFAARNDAEKKKNTFLQANGSSSTFEWGNFSGTGTNNKESRNSSVAASPSTTTGSSTGKESIHSSFKRQRDDDELDIRSSAVAPSSTTEIRVEEDESSSGDHHRRGRKRRCLNRRNQNRALGSEDFNNIFSQLNCVAGVNFL